MDRAPAQCLLHIVVNLIQLVEPLIEVEMVFLYPVSNSFSHLSFSIDRPRLLLNDSSAVFSSLQCLLTRLYKFILRFAGLAKYMGGSH
jgi:hypothetical protein